MIIFECEQIGHTPASAVGWAVFESRKNHRGQTTDGSSSVGRPL